MSRKGHSRPVRVPHALAARGDRIIAKSNLMRQERDMAKIAHAAIREYLAVVRRAVASSRITADASDPDGDDFDDVDLNGLDQSAAWPDILDRTILPAVNKILIGLGPQKYNSKTLVNAMNTWRAAWVAKRKVALAGVPDTITKQIRDAIQADTDLKGPNPRNAANIVKMMLDPDAPTWKSRAMTIARTEVVGANNQGGLASYTAIHQSLAPVGGQVFKTWLATEDSLTRPDHADVDGTEIGISDSFSVGGSQMTGPGDESADPGEVINCRCTLTYRVDDGAGGDEELDADQAEDADDADAASDDADVDDDSLTAAAGTPNTGVAVMLGLAPASETACAATGVAPDPPGLHCTMGYLSEPAASYTPEQQSALISALATVAPQISAVAFATAQFNPNDPEREPCAVLLVQSDELAACHDAVQSAITAAGLEQATTFPIWIPHIAISYNADTSIIPSGAVGSDVQFDRLVVGWGDQQIVATGTGDGTDTAQDDHTDSPADLMAAATPEAPVTAPAATPAGPPQPADGTPSEAEPAIVPCMVQWKGVLGEVDTLTSDGRMISGAGFTTRTLPLPLKYQRMGEHGGEPAGQTEIVGRILTASVQGTLIVATGDFFDPSTGCYAATDAINQVAGGIGGVSVDLPVLVVSYLAPGPNGTLLPIDPSTFIGDYDSIIEVAEQSELAAATIVDVPAFGAARIELITDPSMPNLAPVGLAADAATPQGPVLTTDSITFPDGTVLNVGDQVNIIDATGATDPTTGLIESIDPATNQVTVAVEDPTNPGQTNTQTVDVSSLAVVTSMSNDDTAASGAASGGAVGGTSSGADGLTAALAFPGLQEEHVYPAEWFEPLALDGPTRLTITADGRVYGHAAEFGTCHIGKRGECVAPPRSPSGYGYFHVGNVKTDQGMLPVGKLTVGGGHADIHAGWVAAVEHYDNAGAAVAVVRAHEDEYGIQVTGALLPNATGEQIAALRRNHLSGDWRPIGGHREMIAAHSINTGGFPLTPRAALAADGSLDALVAAGVVYGDEGNGQPELGGLTLPSGTKLSAADVAVLASAYADVIDQRTREQGDAEQRAADVRTLRTKLVRNRLHSVS